MLELARYLDTADVIVVAIWTDLTGRLGPGAPRTDLVLIDGSDPHPPLCWLEDLADIKARTTDACFWACSTR